MNRSQSYRKSGSSCKKAGLFGIKRRILRFVWRNYRKFYSRPLLTTNKKMQAVLKNGTRLNRKNRRFNNKPAYSKLKGGVFAKKPMLFLKYNRDIQMKRVRKQLNFNRKIKTYYAQRS